MIEDTRMDTVTGIWTAVVLCGMVTADIPVMTETDAMVFDPRMTSDNQYYKILHAEESFMLVGGRNFYYNVSTTTFEIFKTYEWYPSDEDISFCNGEIVKFGRDCNSYVTSALKESNTSFVICASSAKSQACRKLKMNEQGKWPLATENVENVPNPLVPIMPWHEVVKLQADTGALYVLGDYVESGSHWCPQLFRDNIYDGDGEVLVGGLRSDCADDVFKVDYTAELPPNYANIFETTDFVYFTFTEPALETFNSIGSQPSIYSRIGRVCKNDEGTNFPREIEKFKFSTLFKARMLCGIPGVNEKVSDKYLVEAYSGYYSYYVDELADASVPQISSVVGAEGEEIIFGIFNSAKNSIKTSAICAYKVSDVNRMFDTAVDQVAYDENLTPRKYTALRPPAKCYNEGEQLTEENKEAANNYLLQDTVRPIGDTALFMSSVDYRMTQMQVDWQVEAGDGKKYDVIFVGTDDGRLLKFVNFANPGENSAYHIVEEREVAPGKEIKELRLVQVDGDKKHLLVNTWEEIKRVAIEKCHMYEDCDSCFGVRDPYCYWSPSIGKCVSTTHTVSDKYQDLSSGRSSLCPAPTTTSAVTLAAEEDETTPGIITVNNPGETRQQQESNKPTVLITLVILLPILSGLLSFVGGYMWSRRRFRSNTPNIDRALADKFQEGSLKGDTYEQFSTSKSNIQLVNNLNGKMPNSETTSTLRRQIQAYV
ncbi:semaphorin-1A-like isoform X2 [Watersipora subatra]|uniref:semaphorin-1A-like isoform X2 n=1 Tax=Watersipora subatra TaxID=2589382 RepID=UPI00355B1033